MIRISGFGACLPGGVLNKLDLFVSFCGNDKKKEGMPPFVRNVDDADDADYADYADYADFGITLIGLFSGIWV